MNPFQKLTDQSEFDNVKVEMDKRYCGSILYVKQKDTDKGRLLRFTEVNGDKFCFFNPLK